MQINQPLNQISQLASVFQEVIKEVQTVAIVEHTDVGKITIVNILM